jgi:hypothetical protein
MEGVYIFENHGYNGSQESALFKRGHAYDGFIVYHRGGNYKVSKFTHCTWSHVRDRAVGLGCYDPDHIMVVATPNLWFEKS